MVKYFEQLSRTFCAPPLSFQTVYDLFQRKSATNA